MVGGDQPGGAFALRRQPAAGARRGRHRADARRDAARCGRQGAAAGDPVERRARGRGVRRARIRRAAHALDHRQRGDGGLHRAQAPVGEEARARAFRCGADGASSQGLCPAADDRRKGDRHVGRERDLVARRGREALVARDAFGDGAGRERDAARFRGERGDRPSPPGGRRGLGDGARAGRGRRRRQCRRGGGIGRDRGRRRVPVARHVGRCLRGDERAPLRSLSRAARLLPRASRPLASDVGDAERRGLPRLGCRALGLRRRALAAGRS